VPLEKCRSNRRVGRFRPGPEHRHDSRRAGNYFDWKQQAHSFDQFAAYAWREVNLTGDREPQKFKPFKYRQTFLACSRVRPQLGRAFLSEEEVPR